MILKEKIYEQIVSAIRKNKTFFLSGHKKPDADTVGSELAFASLLRRLGKSVDIFNAESVPRSLSFLPGVKSIKTAKKVSKIYDVAVIFECSDSDRMGNVIDLNKQARLVINIDHHLKHSFFGHINMIDVHASSNSEQLYRLFEKMNCPILPEEAASLYSGIMADTGRFQHSNTNSETLRIASKLVERGAQVSFLCEKMFGTKSLSCLKLLAMALSNIRVEQEGKLVYTLVTKEDYRKTNSNDEETEDIVNYGLQIPTALISIFFRESRREGAVKISFRSRKHVNVCKLAEEFNGGGHKYASGCEIEGSIQSVMKKVLSRARHCL